MIALFKCQGDLLIKETLSGGRNERVQFPFLCTSISALISAQFAKINSAASAAKKRSNQIFFIGMKRGKLLRSRSLFFPHSYGNQLLDNFQPFFSSVSSQYFLLFLSLTFLQYVQTSAGTILMFSGHTKKR